MFPFSGPAEVRGSLQRLRELLHPILIIIFLIAPWLKINGKQMLLFDVFNRNFIFFGFTFYSHDVPLLFLIVIILILSIFLLTALFGRLWCGWACPQTVFLHGVFSKIERLVLGNYTVRHQFFKSEESIQKHVKIIFLYFIFLLVCWVLSHSFAAYFLGSDVVTGYIFEGPFKHLNSFIFLTVITGILFFNFTFFREKFCFFICPYGRFQNALIDRNTLTVFYDSKRGEERGKFLASKPLGRGDCIDCNRCVSVCPTKIDIRDGFQLECIACGKCIDACNEVMHKTHRSPNLIRYETVNQKPITIKRSRLALYAGLILFFFTALIYSLNQRAQVDLNISRSHQQPFSFRYESGKKVLQNQIVMHLKNQTALRLQINLSLSDKDLDLGFRIVSPLTKIQLAPGQDLKAFGFIEIESDRINSNNLDLVIILSTENSVLKQSFPFIEVD